MIKYFIYCRKSTEEEERQILSIEAQLTELRLFARQNRLAVAKEFVETRTAKEPGRPVFNQMLDELDKNQCGGVLAWRPDRLARNSVDGGRIIYLVDTAKIQSLKFPTFWFEPTLQGKFMMSVAFGPKGDRLKSVPNDNLRENIHRGIRQKLRRGEYPGRAPLGYLNESRLRTIESDPKTFKKVKKVLELENPFYYGHFLLNSELHQGSHKPMISKPVLTALVFAYIALSCYYGCNNKGVVVMAFLFEKLDVYRKAVGLADQLLVVSDQMPRGRAALADQLRRASLSIATNLAEGSGRFHKAEKRNFYLISRGSAYECVPILEICHSHNIISTEAFVAFKDELDQVCRILTTLIHKAS